MNQKLVLGPFLILVNSPKQPLHARNSFKNTIKKIISKNLLKSYIYFFFCTQTLLMDKITKNKIDQELVTNHSSGYKASSGKFLYL